MRYVLSNHEIILLQTFLTYAIFLRSRLPSHKHKETEPPAPPVEMPAMGSPEEAAAVKAVYDALISIGEEPNLENIAAIIGSHWNMDEFIFGK